MIISLNNEKKTKTKKGINTNLEYKILLLSNGGTVEPIQITLFKAQKSHTEYYSNSYIYFLWSYASSRCVLQSFWITVYSMFMVHNNIFVGLAETERRTHTEVNREREFTFLAILLMSNLVLILVYTGNRL